MGKTSKQSAPKLTLTRAKQLAMQEIGTAKGLVLREEMSAPNHPWYEMPMGNVSVAIHQSFDYHGLIQLDISSSTYISSMTALFSGETLVFNMKCTDQYHRDIELEKAGKLSKSQLLKLAERAEY